MVRMNTILPEYFPIIWCLKKGGGERCTTNWSKINSDLKTFKAIEYHPHHFHTGQTCHIRTEMLHQRIKVIITVLILICITEPVYPLTARSKVQAFPLICIQDVAGCFVWTWTWIITQGLALTEYQNDLIRADGNIRKAFLLRLLPYLLHLHIFSPFVSFSLSICHVFYFW